jgi:hypothetical protein
MIFTRLYLMFRRNGYSLANAVRRAWEVSRHA